MIIWRVKEIDFLLKIGLFKMNVTEESKRKNLTGLTACGWNMKLNITEAGEEDALKNIG